MWEMTVEGVDCRIEEPYPFEKGWSERWYSEKFNGPAVRYELAVCIMTGRICWLTGPYAAGKWTDWKIFTERGLMANLDDGERVEADDGYRHGDPRVCKTPGGPWHPLEVTRLRKRARARHEAINGLCKNWKALSTKYRHPLQKHGLIFRAIAVISQIQIKNGQGIFSCDNYNTIHAV